MRDLSFLTNIAESNIDYDDSSIKKNETNTDECWPVWMDERNCKIENAVMTRHKYRGITECVVETLKVAINAYVVWISMLMSIRNSCPLHEWNNTILKLFLLPQRKVNITLIIPYFFLSCSSVDTWTLKNGEATFDQYSHTCAIKEKARPTAYILCSKAFGNTTEI